MAISRRTVLQRAGAGVALAWSAPALLSVGARAAAGTPGGGCRCEPRQPCNVALRCAGTSSCNCWVKADGSGCFCGVLDSCENHEPCVGGACPPGQICVENCCAAGPLCYAPCEVARVAVPPDADAAAYGVAAF